MRALTALKGIWRHPGFWLGTLSVLILLAAWNTGESRLYQFGVLLSATLIAGYWLPRRNVRGIHVSRELPAESHEGDEIEVALQLQAKGFFARYMLQVRDRLPFLDQPDYPVLIARLRGRQQFQYSITCERRGIHTIGPLQVSSEFPLALMRVSLPLTDSLTEIRVLPSTFPIQGLMLAGQTGFPTDSHQVGPASRGQDTFAGVRDYRRGDSMRHIHWRASARRGEWVVREYEQIENAELVIVLNADPGANPGSGRESCFEYAVRIAASLARYATENGHKVGVFCQQMDGVRWLAPDSGWHHYRHALEFLAGVEADTPGDYRQAVEQAATLAGRQGRLWLFHTAESPSTIPAAPALSSRIDQAPVQVAFDAPSFRQRAATQAPSLRQMAVPDLYWISRGANLAEVFAS
ncbi:DUF58 domain-containing protein [Marinobacterium litorale]|uniref:DUF58 domain-containing protein n=1 Tax=Marinobacterium litorale TaxID=404770 RepID=UPI00042A43F0|nr:DUF58 domain-containing protein [Marinobacterium litorale]